MFDDGCTTHAMSICPSLVMATDDGPSTSPGATVVEALATSTRKSGGFMGLLLLLARSTLGMLNLEAPAKSAVMATSVWLRSGTEISNVCRTSRSTMLPVTRADVISGNMAPG